jgi:hypothetical protein
MCDLEMDKLLDGVVGVVEANTFEKHTLWKENRESSRAKKWEPSGWGLGQCVGTIASHPVYISLEYAIIDGYKILFYYGMSAVVDHNMITEWLKRNLPPTAFRDDGYINKTDATNFHCVFPRHYYPRTPAEAYRRFARLSNLQAG